MDDEEKNRGKDDQRVFPEFKEYFLGPHPKKEDDLMKQEKEDELVFMHYIIHYWSCGEIDEQKFNKMSETEKDELAEKYAKKYDLPLPERIKRRLRHWTGPNSYNELKKAGGYKSPMKVERIIQDRFPLSTKGFEKTVGPEFTSYTRKIGNKEVKMVIATELIVPAGDLPKRLFRGIVMFSSQRKTLEPGPIELRELLDRIGELPCSESYMERIRDQCLAISYSSITVKTKNKKGELIHSDHAPFFKRFIWDGELNLNARIFPLLNEELFQLLIDEELTQYVWIPAKRLKPDRKLTARDQLSQDQFRMLLGIPFQRTKLRNWLCKFGQFTEIEILKATLFNIREFVNKNFELAENDELILDKKIKSFHKKSDYLDQVISFHPAKAELPKENVRLTEEDLMELEWITAWLNEITVEDYGKTEGETIEKYLMNAAEAGHLDCIKKAYKETEEWEDYDPYCPVNDDREYENRPMHFWGLFQSYRDDKKC